MHGNGGSSAARLRKTSTPTDGLPNEPALASGFSESARMAVLLIDRTAENDLW
jgi:hypothetical protein